MRFLVIILFFLGFSLVAQSQTNDEALAKAYFEKGEYEKSLLTYQALYEKERRQNYFFKIIDCYVQLENLDKAEALLKEQSLKHQSMSYAVELGYIYQLKKDTLNANIQYNKAIEAVRERPAYTYTVGKRFEDHVLLKQAAQVYEIGANAKPNSNYNIQLGRVYSQLEEFEKMFSAYLGYVAYKPSYMNSMKRIFSQFITEDKANSNNVSLRKALLKRIQSNPNLLWNQLLSWLFVQQKEYKKSFAQEKAIYKRDLLTLEPILDLALVTINEKEYEVSRSILNFIVENSQEPSMILEAQQLLLELDTKLAETVNYNAIEQRYLTLFEQFGRQSQTLDLQVAYAHFLAFYVNDTKSAIKFLKNTLKLKLSPLQAAQVKLELGDILVFEEKFNEALIYYSQIQYEVKNSVSSQIARFKVAKTSYYKGDFNWAESQLKVLKASTSQLTANDALDLKLLISDNRAEDSLQTALKKYAKADLLAFQNRTDEAISLLNTVLKDHKTETIIDQALYKQAQLFEKKNQFDKAEANYQRIISDFKDDILIDDAYYHLAEIYRTKLEQLEKAKELYEKIIFNHADSIYYVEARKKYRALRGDDVN